MMLILNLKTLTKTIIYTVRSSKSKIKYLSKKKEKKLLTSKEFNKKIKIIQ